MHRSSLFVLLVAFCLSPKTIDSKLITGLLYLNDGSVVKGTILEYTYEGFLVQKDDGSQLKLGKDDVEKIKSLDEASAITVSHAYQENPQKEKVVLNDGSILVGNILYRNSSEVILKTELGTFKIPTYQILSVGNTDTEIKQDKNEPSNSGYYSGVNIWQNQTEAEREFVPKPSQFDANTQNVFNNSLPTQNDNYHPQAEPITNKTRFTKIVFLRDGREIIGNVINLNLGYFVIETAMGEVTIPREETLSIENNK